MMHKLTELHEKAVKVLRVIDDADRRIISQSESFAMIVPTFGRMSKQAKEVHRDFFSTKSARTKLIRYHQSILNQINELTTKL